MLAMLAFWVNNSFTFKPLTLSHPLLDSFLMLGFHLSPSCLNFILCCFSSCSLSSLCFLIHALTMLLCIHRCNLFNKYIKCQNTTLSIQKQPCAVIFHLILLLVQCLIELIQIKVLYNKLCIVSLIDQFPCSDVLLHQTKTVGKSSDVF